MKTDKKPRQQSLFERSTQRDLGALVTQEQASTLPAYTGFLGYVITKLQEGSYNLLHDVTQDRFTFYCQGDGQQGIRLSRIELENVLRGAREDLQQHPDQKSFGFTGDGGQYRFTRFQFRRFTERIADALGYGGREPLRTYPF